ncbi:5-formyltetrahydrofolate cyclo-ligase [Lacihabitans sp. CCS-44]|uniref:5-formyltetrahydrofolate cyclo-ligase n=1 Tax=Lacihabitans sp. CCS-44 TaxID=2487331 RepID=UPI0020CE0DE5|nr:5-formyltetrahydrofolate cyclo-ligase [Lacihabitans sp. CCS-44]MCP9756729.1 5-formyltetrahydrofolate cyclo-ligase [Lacihabitans sp. CCS-44]
MTKAEIRKIYKDKRKALTVEQCEKFNKKIHDLVFSRLAIHRYSPIHLFLPILRNNEPNTHLIINTLRKDFAPDLYISKSLENGELVHVKYEVSTILETNAWGIEEPKDLTESLSSEAFFEKYKTEDILIFVPLLAFDKKGNRVGYGKGYYDKFLQFATQDTTIVGLSIFEPVELIEDTDAFDIKINFCVTPERVWQL